MCNSYIHRDHLISSLKTLEHFTNESLELRQHSSSLSGFNYNRDLLNAAVAYSYMETIGKRSDSLYLAIENSSLSCIKNSPFSRISAISEPSVAEERYIIAFDYTTDDFDGEVPKILGLIVLDLPKDYFVPQTLRFQETQSGKEIQH